MTKIGFGNKKLDLVVVLVYAAVTALFVVISFLDAGGILLLGIMLLFDAILFFQKANLAYVSIDQDHFIIERLFKKTEKIDLNKYQDVKKSFSWIPLVNNFKITFVNGESCVIHGGAISTEDVKKSIESCIRMSGKGSL